METWEKRLTKVQMTENELFIAHEKSMSAVSSELKFKKRIKRIWLVETMYPIQSFLCRSIDGLKLVV